MEHGISPQFHRSTPPPTEVGTSATCPADCRGHCCHARERTLLTRQRRSGLSRQLVAESTGTGLDAMPLISESAPPPVENTVLPHEFCDFPCTCRCLRHGMYTKYGVGQQQPYLYVAVCCLVRFRAYTYLLFRRRHILCYIRGTQKKSHQALGSVRLCPAPILSTKYVSKHRRPRHLLTAQGT